MRQGESAANHPKAGIIGLTMLPLIEQNREAIEKLCRTYHVARLELFGSAARGDFNEQTSDLDFFVEFEDLGWQGSFKRYMGLKLDMEKLFGRSVDLIEPCAIRNPYFEATAMKHKALVYAA